MTKVLWRDEAGRPNGVGDPYREGVRTDWPPEEDTPIEDVMTGLERRIRRLETAAPPRDPWWRCIFTQEVAGLNFKGQVILAIICTLAITGLMYMTEQSRVSETWKREVCIAQGNSYAECFR
jgi:hypothetical protein